MRLDDFVLLGRTVPESSKKYGHRVCSVGYSHELGQLIRVYPLPVQNGLRQWDICTLELERPQSDSRRESFALRDRGNGSIAVCGHSKRGQWHKILDSMTVPSIAELNRRRASIGVLKPVIYKGAFRNRSGISDPSQGVLFEYCDARFGADAIDVMPVVDFEDEDGPHCLQVREIGAYEFLRKHRFDANSLWNNYRLLDDSCDVYLIVGNMNNYRTSWLVVNVIAFKRCNVPLLF